MITNKGKNIIAKYLIGDAPAYASYIALGCGPRPRPTINEKSGVSLATITGGILQTGSGSGQSFSSIIENISSTIGLQAGMIIKKVGSVGGVLGNNATITAVIDLKTITIHTTSINTPGSVDFSTGGTASVLSVGSTEGLWVGARVTNSQFPFQQNTIITSINPSGTRFTVSPGIDQVTFPILLGLETNPEKKVLDFEMFRVPISSRGYVNDNGTNKIVLTAQLPSEERYEITEVGVYSSGSNAAAGRYDSKVITAFSNNENWQRVIKQEPVGQETPAITILPIPRYVDSILTDDNIIKETDPVLKTDTTNGLFLDPDRSEIYEKPRFLSNVIMLKSDSSQIFTNTLMQITVGRRPELRLEGSSNYIEITGKSIDLSKNSTSDLLKVAFSLISVDADTVDLPSFVNLIVEFSNSSNSQVAKLEINADGNVLDFAKNRYIVSQKRIDEIIYEGSSFSWRDISVIKIYASANDRLSVTNKIAADGVATITMSGQTNNAEVGQYVSISIDDSRFDGYRKVIAKDATTISFSVSEEIEVGGENGIQVNSGHVDVINNKFYISLDAIRLDNISSENPLYGLTGYSIVQNSQESAIVKSPNTNNYLEYRFVLDVT
jgi:hypothetical protein